MVDAEVEPVGRVKRWSLVAAAWVSLAGMLAVGCPAADDDNSGDGGQPADDDAAAPVVINEFMATNALTAVDDSGTTPDWVELYNLGGEDLDLGGYYLTDDLSEPRRHRLAEGLVIQAGGHLLLIADGEPALGDDHLGFKLSRDGEQLGLSDGEGRALDAVEFSEQLSDWSTGRFPDGSDSWEVTWQVTPGTANGDP